MIPADKAVYTIYSISLSTNDTACSTDLHIIADTDCQSTRSRYRIIGSCNHVIISAYLISGPRYIGPLPPYIISTAWNDIICTGYGISRPHIHIGFDKTYIYQGPDKT